MKKMTDEMEKKQSEPLEDKLRSDVQEKFLKCFREGDIYGVNQLIGQTGLEPIIDDKAIEAIQQGHVHCLTGLIGDSISLEEFTGIKPTGESIQQAYIKCFREGLSYYIEQVIEIKEITGVEPIINDEAIKAVQEGYLNCLKFEIYEPSKVILDLREFTGVEQDRVMMIDLCPPDYNRYLNALISRKEARGMKVAACEFAVTNYQGRALCSLAQDCAYITKDSLKNYYYQNKGMELKININSDERLPICCTQGKMPTIEEKDKAGN